MSPPRSPKGYTHLPDGTKPNTLYNIPSSTGSCVISSLTFYSRTSVQEQEIGRQKLQIGRFVIFQS